MQQKEIEIYRDLHHDLIPPPPPLHNSACFFPSLYIFFYSAFQVTAPRVIINLVKMKFLPFFNAIPLMSVLMPVLVTLMPLVTIQAQEVTSANVKRDSPETEPIVLVLVYQLSSVFLRPEFLEYFFKNSVINKGFTGNGTQSYIVLISISAFICFFSTRILEVFLRILQPKNVMVKYILNKTVPFSFLKC